MCTGIRWSAAGTARATARISILTGLHSTPRRSRRLRNSTDASMEAQILKAMLMYFILPIWLIGGVADYLCHRSSSIEITSGWPESLLHLIQLTEMGIPILALMFFEVNALIIAMMIVFLVLHEATAWWNDA